MRDFCYLNNQKVVFGSTFIKNTKMSMQSTADSILMYHFPNSSMATETLINILQTHLYTLSIFESYLKLQKDSEYQESTKKYSLLNMIRPNIHLCSSI
jgi:hypothetical protein